jgi:putative ABC transport system ATP-binding protein
VIEIENLRFAWPRAESDCLAIDRLSIAAGSTLFLYGPSGSGKSTLLGLLAGVLVARQGRVGVLDTDWSSLSGARRDALRADHVGYIFQQFNLLPYLNVIDNVLLPCRFSRLRHERAVRRSGSVQADAGALLYGLEQGWPLQRCVALGNRLGAAKIACRGGQNHPVDPAWTQA